MIAAAGRIGTIFRLPKLNLPLCGGRLEMESGDRDDRRFKNSLKAGCWAARRIYRR
jgi:hypothetical protein